ncbi:hypothetical protein CRUP_036363 [Coryphaenoides rupestris]|nr:hypothetical protein CRUP_036363 [Coryphaenoides rupestris]
MPISSGAAGRVAVGADMAIAWTPDGVKETKLHNNRSNDSYLKRFHDTNSSEEKRWKLQPGTSSVFTRKVM